MSFGRKICRICDVGTAANSLKIYQFVSSIFSSEIEMFVIKIGEKVNIGHVIWHLSSCKVYS